MSSGQMSKGSGPTIAPGCLIVVAAPSGAGKTTLVRLLAEVDPRVRLSVSYTTRDPRPGEIDGEHYLFVDRGYFESLIADGALVEHALVHGNHYGTSRLDLRNAIDAGLDVILEIDWQGARQVRAKWPEAISIFVLPPSPQTLIERLHRRGLDSAEVIARRLANARAEMEHHDEFDYLIVNDDLDQAVAALTAIVNAQRQRSARQRVEHARLIGELLA